MLRLQEQALTDDATLVAAGLPSTAHRTRRHAQLWIKGPRFRNHSNPRVPVARVLQPGLTSYFQRLYHQQVQHASRGGNPRVEGPSRRVIYHIEINHGREVISGSYFRALCVGLYGRQPADHPMNIPVPC